MVTRSCGACSALTQCKQAFGRYWADKSHGGTGCEHPFGGWQVPKMPRRRKNLPSGGNWAERKESYEADHNRWIDSFSR